MCTVICFFEIAKVMENGGSAKGFGRFFSFGRKKRFQMCEWVNAKMCKSICFCITFAHLLIRSFAHSQSGAYNSICSASTFWCINMAALRLNFSVLSVVKKWQVPPCERRDCRSVWCSR